MNDIITTFNVLDTTTPGGPCDGRLFDGLMNVEIDNEDVHDLDEEDEDEDDWLDFALFVCDRHVCSYQSFTLP